MTRGITLLEILLALVVAGILLGIAIPGAGAIRNRLRVDQAASALAGAHARARITAQAEQRVMVLALSADTLVLGALESRTDTVERWRGPGPGSLGVGATGLPHVTAFAPSGVSIGLANSTYTLTRGGARKQVIVSRYGRVRIQ